MGRQPEAIRYAESGRGPGANDYDVDKACEEILRSLGLIDETYRRFGRANRAGTMSRPISRP